jgi:hypothetical protein
VSPPGPGVGAHGAGGATEAVPGEPLDVLVVYVPSASTEAVLTALFAAGAGRLGRYAECAFVTAGRGQFRPLDGAAPTIGSVGRVARVDEDRIEVMMPRSCSAAVVTAMRAAHPYEEPAFHVLNTAAQTGGWR